MVIDNGTASNRRAALVAMAAAATSVGTNIPQNDSQIDDERIAVNIANESTKTRSALNSASLQAIQHGGVAREALTSTIRDRTWVNVKDFGALGDGSTDDAPAFQAAIHSLSTTGRGGTVWIPRGDYLLSSPVSINAPGISIDGALPNINGCFTIGEARQRKTMRGYIQNLSFKRSAYEPGSSFVEFRRVREFQIRDCFFEGADRAINVAALSESTHHNNAMLVIDRCQFSEVDNAFYVDKHSSSVWGATSDVKFTNNIVNLSYKCGVYVVAADGITITDNVFFFLNFNSSNARLQEKRDNIYIGESNFVHIHNNNLFEPGRNGIRLASPQVVSITGNNIAWPGQLEPAEGIYIYGSSLSPSDITIQGNTISKYTRSAVQVSGPIRSLVLSGNSVRYDPATKSYIGSTPLSSLPHYRYEIADQLVGALPFIGDPVSNNDGEQDRYPNLGRASSIFRLGRWSQSGSANTVATIKSTPSVIFNLLDAQRSSSGAGGLLVITAKRGNGSTSRTATYVLLVGLNGPQATAVEIAKEGDITGAAAAHPSFRWSVVDGNLMAAALGSTAGEFNFTATWTGNLTLR